MVAAGLDGIQRGLELPDAFTGNAYLAESGRISSSMTDALRAWQDSPWIAETFGEVVQAHYANMAQVELAAFGRAVTDWERFRNFERT
jgi:glutamine synthetase